MASKAALSKVICRTSQDCRLYGYRVLSKFPLFGGKGTSPPCFIIWTLNSVNNFIVMVNRVIRMKNEKCPSQVSGIGILGLYWGHFLEDV